MKRILVVEDDVHLQFLIKEELSDDGYEVSIASNGREALDYLLESDRAEPDLIIMDIRMPKMDGVDTMGHILKSRIDKPLIIHSAYSSYKDDPLIMAADAYVLKSPDFTKLKAAVSKLIGPTDGEGKDDLLIAHA
ncbi:MAG TPA: response regulator [Deltaproteobacteria bacterium]|nr:response regulator [Deltaproteobacteria bacterium]